MDHILNNNSYKYFYNIPYVEDMNGTSVLWIKVSNYLSAQGFKYYRDYSLSSALDIIYTNNYDIIALLNLRFG